MAVRTNAYGFAAERPRAELFAGLAALYHSRDYSDLVLHGKDGTPHPVHKAIVCPRSPYLAEAVKERRWRDGTEGHIALHDADEVVRLMVEYLYLLDYNPMLPPNTNHHSTSTSTSDDLRSQIDSGSSGSSDTMSVRTDAGTYGHVYGTSAVSAFGGPGSRSAATRSRPSTDDLSHHLSSHHISANFRARTDTPLTVHALPAGISDFSDFSPRPSGASPRPYALVSLSPVSSRGKQQQQQQQQQSGGRSSTTAMIAMAGTASAVPRHPPDPSPLASTVPHLALHARMYTAAHRYGVVGLKALALDKFKIQLTRHWDSDELAEAIHIVFNETPSTDKDMREAVADVLGWYGRLLDKPEIEAAIMEINGLAYELLKRSRRIEPEYMDSCI